MGKRKLTKKLPTLIERLKSVGSENAKAAHVRGNAAGAHEKDINKHNRRRNKIEERAAEGGYYNDDNFPLFCFVG